MDYSILADELQNLKCLLCNNYLSYFPILQNKQGNICGRCSAGVHQDGQLKNQAYETTAGFFKFPCRYQTNGCIESMIPEMVPNHEEICVFKTVICPTKYSQNCSWHGPHNNLDEHLRECHSSLILNSPTFEMNLVNPYTHQLLLLYGDELFLLNSGLNAASEIYAYSLLYLGLNRRPEDYEYHLKIEDPIKKLQMQLFSQNPSKDSSATEVPVSQIRRELEDPLAVVGRIVIKLLEAEQAPRTSNDKISQALEIVKIMECPICMEYIVPPIYQCLSGHSICEKCKTTLTQCAICQKEFNGTRNYDLEKVATLLNYPCKNAELGCTYCGKCIDIKQHEKICIYSQPCPLMGYVQCKERMHYNDIYKHIKEKHPNHILNISEVIEVFDHLYMNNTYLFYYIHKIYNKIFKIHFKCEKNIFYWAVQLIGDPSECINYNFEVDIFNSNFPNSRMFIKAPVNNGEAMDFIEVYLSQIRSSGLDEKLSYKIRILKC